MKRQLTAMEKIAMDAQLIEIDDGEIAAGRPPLSVTVCHDDGAPATATLATIRKHGLARPDESIEDCIERLRNEVHQFWKGKKL